MTSGWDDTLKASGHCIHDTKTGWITCVNKEEDNDRKCKKQRKSFTTGFIHNISHNGEDAALSVQSVLAKMADLCNV